MNRFVRLIKENVVPFIVFMVIAVSCCGAWFFFHPSSPYHDRYSFVVSFQAVGTLSPGNLVAIQGIPCGEITKVELTDDAVYVTARVLATTVIPVNSDFRLINSGLMGEREMCILSGDSSRLVADGDTLVGFYDAGTSGIGKKISTIILDVSEIKDTLSVGATGKSVERVFRKGRMVTRSAKSNLISWKEGTMGVLDGMDHSLEDAKATLNAVSAKGGASLSQVDGFLDRINDLLANVQKMKGQSEEILGKLLKEDNSAGLLMDSRSQFNEELNKLLKDVDRLLEDIKKSGLNINIDIF